MNEKKAVIRTIFLSTLAFALLLTAALAISAAAAESLPERIEKALARGDTARASTLTARIKDEELRAAFETRCSFAEAAAKSRHKPTGLLPASRHILRADKAHWPRFPLGLLFSHRKRSLFPIGRLLPPAYPAAAGSPAIHR